MTTIARYKLLFSFWFKPYARKLKAEAIHSKIENVEVISSMKRTIPGVFFFSGRLYGTDEN